MTGPFVIAASPHVHLTSVEDAENCSAAIFYPATIDQLTAGQSFTSEYRILRAGPITIAEATTHADIRMDFTEGRSGYHVNVPVAGSVQSRHRAVDLTATSDTAAVYSPHGDAAVTCWTAETRLVAMKMDRGFVERTLSEALREPVTDTSPLVPSIDVRGGHGRSWADLLRHLRTQLGDPDSVLHEPIAAMPFVEAVINGFLVVASPAYREALTRAEPARPAVVRDATDIMDAEAHTPLTTAEIARRCHVSVRTLQEGFRGHLGTTPMAYLRSVRLSRAHAELRAADPARGSVGAIARRWGFTNLTRFANQHRSTYGEFPHETLRAVGSP